MALLVYVLGARGKMQKNLCAILGKIARRLRCSDKRRYANIRRRSEAKHCSSLCLQSEGDEYCGGQTRLKIQRRYTLKRWLYSLCVRGPHFASKVSYNAGAAIDGYAGQCKTPLRGRCRLFVNLELSEFLTPYLLGALSHLYQPFLGGILNAPPHGLPVFPFDHSVESVVRSQDFFIGEILERLGNFLFREAV